MALSIMFERREIRGWKDLDVEDDCDDDDSDDTIVLVCLERNAFIRTISRILLRRWLRKLMFSWAFDAELWCLSV